MSRPKEICQKNRELFDVHAETVAPPDFPCCGGAVVSLNSQRANGTRRGYRPSDGGAALFHINTYPSRERGFPDGARGDSVYGGDEPGFATSAEFNSRAAWQASLLYRNSDAIVPATFVDSEPFVLTTHQAAIYTFSHLSIKQILKGDGRIATG